MITVNNPTRPSSASYEMVLGCKIQLPSKTLFIPRNKPPDSTECHQPHLTAPFPAHTNEQYECLNIR